MDTGQFDADFACVSLHRDEILAINNALNEVLFGADAISRSEFHTRIDVFGEEAFVLLGQVGALLDEMHPEFARKNDTKSSYFNNLR